VSADGRAVTHPDEFTVTTCGVPLGGRCCYLEPLHEGRCAWYTPEELEAAERRIVEREAAARRRANIGAWLAGDV
jgi:hypothetical protein